MATLPVPDQQRVWRALMRHWSRFREPTTGFDKNDLLDAVQAADSWIDSNQASYNNALPETFRVNASTAQKTLLFCAVALARVSIPFLRKMFGGLD